MSQLISMAVRWRLASRRLLNFLKREITAKTTPFSGYNDVQIALQQFLDDGFDKLNVGGGPKNLEGFINVDFVAHSCVIREIVANAMDLSFVPTNCVSHIHSNHFIEHLSEDQIIKQLQDYRRILKHGGLLTIRCPNALGACYGFWCRPVIESGKQEFVALGFPSDEDFARQDDDWMHRDLYGLLHWLYADAGNHENQHLTLVTPTKLKKWLTAAGFEILKMTEPEAVNIAVVAIKGNNAGRDVALAFWGKR